MRFLKAILAAVATFAVARLLAPKETDQAVEMAKRSVRRGIASALSTVSDAETAGRRVSAAAADRVKSSAAKTKKTVVRKAQSRRKPAAHRG